MRARQAARRGGCYARPWTKSSPPISTGFGAQRLAYDAATHAATDARPGTTELELVARIEAALGARGVRRWFHPTFAWFGERSRFEGPEEGPRRRFYPSDARLKPGMVGIVDVAPIVDGFTGDVSYTFRCAGGDRGDELDRALAALREIRAAVPTMIGRGLTMREIYLELDRRFAARGFDTRHVRYPFGVLGHRVDRIAPREREPRIAGFGLAAIGQLAGGAVTASLGGILGRSRLWTRDADRRLEPGLWSMEPHLGGSTFGAKFEEILVVERGRARWLDDDVPHAADYSEPTT